MFLTSCAYQGVIVQKQSRSHPLYHSVGIEGVYTFVLRDSAGALHRQMVTPEVFESYAEGNYKATQTAAHDLTGAPARNTASTTRAKIAKTKQVASKTKRSTAKSTKSAATRTQTRSTAKRATAQDARKKGQAPAAKSAGRRAGANHRKVAKKTSKPWEMTPQGIQSTATSTNPEPPSEGPAADTPAVPSRPPAAKPAASPDESDIVYIPPRPR